MQSEAQRCRTKRPQSEQRLSRFADPEARMASEGLVASVLKRELLNFKVKINVATGHDSYEAWPVGPGKGILGGGWG
jgi:hypothetical protein